MQPQHSKSLGSAVLAADPQSSLVTEASSVELGRKPRFGRSGRGISPLARREEREGWVWVQAWFVGFLLFTLIPVLAAFYLSFTDWNGQGSPRWIGLANYQKLLTADPLFWQSLKVTGTFAILYLPLSLLLGFGMALLMNQRFIGVRAFRTIYYLPSVLSGVAVAVLWQFVFNRDFGILNWFVGLFGIPPISWLSSEAWVLPSLVIIQLWGVGSSIIIYLGGLQGIPTELYEAARIDGARAWHTLRHITIPMMSPVILFQMILGAIATLQIFTEAYIITGGGPNYSSFFLSMNIYVTAFQQLRLGYASAMSVMLFLILLVVTLLILRLTRSKIYYAGARDEES